MYAICLYFYCIGINDIEVMQNLHNSRLVDIYCKLFGAQKHGIHFIKIKLFNGHFYRFIFKESISSFPGLLLV